MTWIHDGNEPMRLIGSSRIRYHSAIPPASLPSMTTININGQVHEVDLSPDTPLLWTLRDALGFTGTKFGCGMALCGACTVHVDGQPVRSCVTPISAIGTKRVRTIESMDADHVGRAVQDAWVELGVAQCGYCQAGQIMTATALLKANPKPSDEQIVAGMSGNLCRCGTYTRINAAVKLASSRLAANKTGAKA